MYHENVTWNDDILLKVENVYNNTVNRSTGKTPDEAFELDATEQKVLHEKLKTNASKRYKEIDTKLNVGDSVRVLVPTGKIKNKGQPIWSEEVFKIKRIINGVKENFTINRYTIEDSDGVVVKGSFPLSKLLLIP